MYVTLALTALQTMMASSYGAASDVVQLASWWFSALSLTAVAVMVVLMALLLVFNFVSNLVATLIHIGNKNKNKKEKEKMKQKFSEV